MKALLCRLGLMEYQPVYDLQTRLAAARYEGCLATDCFLVVEHPRVYTLGRRGGREHLTVSEQFLAENNIPVIPIERGGVITYHGPGQLVIYPIIKLHQAHYSVGDYIFQLEALMVSLAAEFGVTAVRDNRNHGVWCGDKKLGSVGIAIRRGVSFHGLALNINPDMEPFHWINPCGLTNVQMTSLSQETGQNITVQMVSEVLEFYLEQQFPHQFNETGLQELRRVVGYSDDAMQFTKYSG